MAPIAEKAAELCSQGFCLLRGHLPKPSLEACRKSFWTIWQDYIQRNRNQPNRGVHRHFLPMPFDRPCFAPEFFFDPVILGIVKAVMDDRIVADQWGCDVPLKGSEYQPAHVDYRRPLFGEQPDLMLPAYMLVVSFGLTDITAADGPMEIAPGTRLTRELGEVRMQPILMGVGDVLIRHPWALHRGTPNTTDTPRMLLTVRYVRSWYADSSREVNAIPQAVWQSLTSEQQSLLRFPVG